MEGYDRAGEGVIGGPGEGEDADGAGGGFAAEGGDDGLDGGARREDVVDNKIGGGRIDDIGCVYAEEVGFTFGAGEVLVAEGLAGFGEEGGKILATEIEGQRAAEEVERGGADVLRGEFGVGVGGGGVMCGESVVGVGGGGVMCGEFAVAEGPEEDGVAGRRFFGEGFAGGVDPGFEIGMGPTFELHQAA